MKRKRLQPKLLRVLPVFIGFVFFVIIFIYITLQVQAYVRVLPRMTVVIVGSPMYVVSIDAGSLEGVILRIPETTWIEASHGYGKYSLEALWKLGNIERNHTLLNESLSYALGVPVQYYIAPKTTRSFTTSSEILNELTYQKGIEGIYHGTMTNISFGVRAALQQLVSNAQATRIPIVDFARSSTVVEEQEPDGSIRHVLDVSRLDIAMPQGFEVERIRKERLKVTIYNTTTTPGLGTSVARMINNTGAHVIHVDNDVPEIQRCLVSASIENLKTLTVSYIVHIYGCEIEVGKLDEQTDIELRLGVDVSERLYNIQ